METTFTNENIYIPLKPLFVTARIFGLVDTQFFNEKNNEEYKTRFQHILLAFLWNTIFLLWMYYTVLPVSYNPYGFPDKVNTILIVYYITLLATKTVTSISASINRKKFIGVLQKLMDIDKVMKCKETTELCRRTKYEVLSQIAALPLVISIAFPLELFYYSDGTLRYSLCHGLELLICCLNAVTLLLYINIVRMMRHRYKTIFEYLEYYVKIIDLSSGAHTNYFIAQHRGCCEHWNVFRSRLQLLSNRSSHLQ
jgi:hypothetical protein